MPRLKPHCSWNIMAVLQIPGMTCRVKGWRWQPARSQWPCRTRLLKAPKRVPAASDIADCAKERAPVRSKPAMKKGACRQGVRPGCKSWSKHAAFKRSSHVPQRGCGKLTISRRPVYDGGYGLGEDLIDRARRQCSAAPATNDAMCLEYMIAQRTRVSSKI